MKKVWLLALCDFLLWEKCFNFNKDFVDEIYIRVDKDNTDPIIIDRIKLDKKVKSIIFKSHDSSSWGWREDLLRMLDESKPDIVIALDVDECFDYSMKEEILEFWKSDKKSMMVSYNMCPSKEGTCKVVYPSKPHMKIFKWQPFLSYIPYLGYAQINQYANKPENTWYAKSKIDHFCMWTESMEKIKTDKAMKKYGTL